MKTIVVVMKEMLKDGGTYNNAFVENDDLGCLVIVLR